MLFTPEIVSAFETIINAAENDFEMHRIKVLLKDLTAPPTVEQIDDKHQKFNGVVYNKENKNHYQCKISIHRDIWEYYFGEIPEGYVVHHKDFNPENNSVENLQIMGRDEHMKFHNKNRRRIENTCVVCGKKFLVAQKTTQICSEYCRTHAVKYKKTCVVCGKEFVAAKWAKTVTCSGTCANRMRWNHRREKEKKSA